jgi:hypothetical protein
VDFLLERMTRQGLASRGNGASAQVASSAVGLQAQDLASARLGVRARTNAVDEASVVKAGDIERSVVRTWLMRATVHLVAAEDAKWMAELFGPMIERRFMNVRWRELGITADVIDGAIPHAREVLAGRELTRHKITAELASRGVRLAPDGQAATHLLLALSARGVTCRASDRGRDTTFALLDDWVGAASAPPDPLAELARRYFKAFGPATAADFTTWSGLPSAVAIKAIRDELTEVEFDGRRGWTFGDVEPVTGFRLLPMFDNYLLAYRDRTALLDPGLHNQVYVGGIIKATVVTDGRIIGTWRLARSARSRRIEVTAFKALTRAHRRELDRERADMELFFGGALDLRIAG